MSAPSSAVFSPRTVALLIVAGGVAFAGAAYLAAFGDQERSIGADSFSRSAIGHKAFVELLRRRGNTVVVSRGDSAAKAGAHSLLVIAEPLPEAVDAIGGIPQAERTLLVLPKWRGSPDPDHAGWVRRVTMRSPDAVAAVLRRALPEGALIRPSRTAAWRTGPAAAVAGFGPRGPDRAALWNRLRSRAAPVLDTPQLIAADGLIPILATPDGVLAGAARTADGWLFVIADPDLLANHGIGRDDNAALALDLIDLFKPDGGPIVIDEMVHGFYRDPSLWRLLIEPPFVAPTILSAAAIIVLLFAVTSRFGAPLPARPRSGAKDAGLIENAVDLLRQAGHAPTIAQRYPAVVLRQVSHRLHTPRQMNNEARLEWLDRVAAARGIRTRYRALREELDRAASGRLISEEHVLRAAQRLHQWKQEMLNGPGRHTGG